MKIYCVGSVTQKNIDNGKRYGVANCPLSLALSDAFAGNIITAIGISTIRPRFISINNQTGEKEYVDELVLLNKFFQTTLHQFDDTGYCEPFSFVLYRNDYGVLKLLQIPATQRHISPEVLSKKLEFIELLEEYWAIWKLCYESLKIPFGDFLYRKKDYHYLPVLDEYRTEYNDEKVKDLITEVIW